MSNAALRAFLAAIFADTDNMQPKMGTPTTNLSSDLRQYGAGFLATKSITLSLAAVPVTETLFTVTGEVEVIVMGYIDTAVAGAGLTLEVGVAGATAGLIAQTAVAALLVNLLWMDAAPAVLVTKPAWKAIANGLDIAHVIRTAAATGGAITYYCWWRPLSTDGNLVAA